jgi:hypothetical protein
MDNIAAMIKNVEYNSKALEVDVSYKVLQAAWAALQAAQVKHAVLVEELEQCSI